MSNELILSFPVLKDDGGDFLESIRYTVDATQGASNGKLYITHTLKGQSFISQLLRDGKAKFSVSLLYKDNAERQSSVCDECSYDEDVKEASAEQIVDIDYNYAPEITPYIVIMENKSVVADSNSGLADFWQTEVFEIPAFSKLAHHSKLEFSSGNVSSLMWKEINEDYKSGTIKTSVIATSGEGEQPIKVVCAKDVYDELDRGFSGQLDAGSVVRKSIVTQILCHVYAHMNNLKDKETDIHSGLLKHMETVVENTGEDWMSDGNFNASFAATGMVPYEIEVLNRERG